MLGKDGNQINSSSCENPEGWIEDISTQTANTTNYWIPKDGYKYVNKENDLKAYFPEDPNKGWKFENDAGESSKIEFFIVADKKLIKNNTLKDAVNSQTESKINQKGKQSTVKR